MNRETVRIRRPDGVELVAVRGDLTAERVDAIVNAANEQLQHGGGVAGAIVRRGGPSIQEESRRIAPVPTGSAKATRAGLLRCRYVIHAVGPIWRGGDSGEPDLLASAVQSALRVAVDLGCASVSMPAISSGIYGFPVDRAARVIVGAAVTFLQNHPGTCLREVRFCNLDERTAFEIEAALSEIAQDSAPVSR